MTELITVWTRQRIGRLSEKLNSYRAGFLPEDRRNIEAKLSNGELLGVISTSALELGIDIGDLDVCILVGYPGSIMSSMQRGGRVGRGKNESLVILVASEDALDQYLMKNPDAFFQSKVESAIINPMNASVMRDHLQCAAAEIPLHQKEIAGHDIPPSLMDEMLTSVTLLQSRDGQEYYAARKRPQRYVNLRGSSNSMAIINGQSGEIVGEIDSLRALKECHEGAVYMHNAKTWVVDTLDLLGHEVVVSEKMVRYYTKTLSNKNTEILSILKRKTVCGCSFSFGTVRVTEKVTSYHKKNTGTNRTITTIPLDLPEQIIETEGLWFEIPSSVVSEIEERKLHFMGGLHALEHLLISVFPFLILCDRNDIGGISCPAHEQTSGATIFIYDGHSGGSGLACEAFERVDELIAIGARILSSCSCENGCPGCVHSPKCGSGNRPIDKESCRQLLLSIQKTATACSGVELIETHIDMTKETNIIKGGLDFLPDRWAVFDLETKFSADEVGGWHQVEKMGLSLGVVYDSEKNDFITFHEHQEEKFVEYLRSFDLIIGFNNKRFDNRVLYPYGGRGLLDIPSLDILEEITNRLGYRLSLNSVANSTLDLCKKGDGLQALEWFRNGQLDLLERYCREDVSITRDLFLFGLEEGYFLFQNKAKKQVRLPLNFRESLQRVLTS